MANDNTTHAENSPKKSDAMPAGPHAKPELTNEDATPGAGSLPSTKENSADVDSGTG